MSLRDDIVKALRRIYDPEIPVNIYDLGLIYDLDVAEDGRVKIRMTLTAPNCPVAGSLPSSVEHAVRAVAGVADVQLELTFDPPWSKDRMSPDARLMMGMDDEVFPVWRPRA